MAAGAARSEPRARRRQAGLKGKLDGATEEFVIGYDGEAYVRGLASHNAVVVERADGSTCRAEFTFKPATGQQVVIRNAVCS
ncbi:FimD/PapC C-terminal domain-containing protein [Mesorhizobium sp. M0830]|uniref:FimD/PapC C-terminal domain-containing protein n=1 Tax=Mesorhizobium sp. M0830 TaxID=2957008 RepID=UPI00333B055D